MFSEYLFENDEFISLYGCVAKSNSGGSSFFFGGVRFLLHDICCTQQDILKDQWSPALTTKTVLLSLQALLCSPEPDDPQDAEVAKMYKDDYETFKNTAKFWTETYAKETSKDEIIARICDMGFDKESSRKALEKHNWDESDAVNALLGI